MIATEYVSHAVPDANTALIMSNSFVINPHMRTLAYDPLTSFTPMCNLVTSPNLIVVNANAPYRTLADLLTAAREKPGELTMSSVGLATTQHIGFAPLKLDAKVNMTYVPFPGGAPAVNALLGDHVTAVYGNYSEVFEQIKAGKLRALAATGARRIAMLPDLPTVAEQGFPGYDVEVWLGTVVPAGTPQAAVGQLVVHGRHEGAAHPRAAPRFLGLTPAEVRRVCEDHQRGGDKGRVSNTHAFVPPFILQEHWRSACVSKQGAADEPHGPWFATRRCVGRS